MRWKQKTPRARGDGMKSLQSKLLRIGVFIPDRAVAKQEKLLAQAVGPLSFDGRQGWSAWTREPRATQQPRPQVRQLLRRAEPRPFKQEQVGQPAVLRQIGIDAGQQWPVLQRVEVSRF